MHIVIVMGSQPIGMGICKSAFLSPHYGMLFGKSMSFPGVMVCGML